jgi:hypothetical protein
VRCCQKLKIVETFWLGDSFEIVKRELQKSGKKREKQRGEKTRRRRQRDKGRPQRAQERKAKVKRQKERIYPPLCLADSPATGGVVDKSKV